MSVSLRFEYKCRRCGEIHGQSGMDIANQSKAIAIMMSAAMGGATTQDVPELIAVHTCTSGAIGITDLIGASKQ